MTLVVGAVLAVVQTNVKRMLAYSSINHAGFILLGCRRPAPSASRPRCSTSAPTRSWWPAASEWSRSSPGGATPATSSTTTSGLARRAPLLALAFTLFLLAQAGVPLTAGFFAKVYVLRAAIDAGSWPLALAAMVTAVVSAFLYLRIIVAMYMADADAEQRRAAPVRASASPPWPVPASPVAAAFTLVVGFVPQPVTEVVGDATPVATTPR